MNTFSSYAVISASSDTGTWSVGSHVQFNTVTFVGTAIDSSNVSCSTGSGQAQGVITLSGRRFLLISSIRGQVTDGYCDLVWTDNVAGTPILDELGVVSMISTMLDSSPNAESQGFINAWHIVDARSAPIVMDLRITRYKSSTSFRKIYFGQTHCMCVPILE